MSDPDRILLVGGKEKALAAARSLGARDMDVDVVASDLDYRPAFYSRHVSRTYRAPPQGEYYVEFLEDLLERRDYDLLIPLEIPRMGELVSGAEQLQSYTRVAAPPEEAYAKVHNKVKTEQASERAGVTTPETEVYKISEIGGELPRETPFVVKHATSEGGRGVKYVETRGDWKEVLKEFKSLYRGDEKILLQEFISGPTVSAGVIVKDGSIEVFSVEERVHELEMGPSSYRKSSEKREDLFESAEKMLGEIGWEGPAYLEFRYDEEDPVLIEVNGRFWGSITVSMYAGVDFPYLLYMLYMDEELPEEELEYRENIFSRNMIRETEWFMEELSRGGLPVGPGWLSSFKRLLQGKEHFDEITLRDPLPGFYTLLYMLRKRF